MPRLPVKRAPILTLLSGLLGFLAIALGAFGTHALSVRFTADQQELWRTASLYALTHAPAALAASLAAERSRWLVRAASLFLAGVFIFSGSLYLLALGGPRAFGMTTPVGGLLLLAGWACVALAARR
ncbi:MAG: DUF423 domain-containing protein [Amphiplicatus sp.]